MSIIRIKDIKPTDRIPGTTSRFIHTENMTLGYWTFKPGIKLPEHSHMHEQVSNIIEGTFEFTIDNEVKQLDAGCVAVIPPEAIHSGKAITKCKIIDVFYPVREDFK